jgi:ribosomal protein S18 acetylase RimI-like enzyme
VAAVEVSVTDAQDRGPDAKRAALRSHNWMVDADLLQLEASTEGLVVPEVDIGQGGIIEIDASDPEVVRVMAAAMTDSLDGYDRDRVAALGAEQAAQGYRDMKADGPTQVPWLAHRGPGGIDGIAAIQPYPTDWALGYLGVAPQARRTGVGTRLARAMLTATARAGVPAATANVATANVRIRGTLDRVGFRVTSPRTDFVLRLGPASGLPTVSPGRGD